MTTGAAWRRFHGGRRLYHFRQHVRDSVVFSGVRTHSHAVDRVLGAAARRGHRAARKMRKAIIDRGCVIPEGMRIGVDPEEDRANGFRVTKGGVVLVTRGMLGQAEGRALVRPRQTPGWLISANRIGSTRTKGQNSRRRNRQWKREHR
jgi:hypothetical protein